MTSSEDAVAGKMLSVEKVWGKGLNGDGEVFPEHDGPFIRKEPNSLG
jgi:hypothetical protein